MACRRSLTYTKGSDKVDSTFVIPAVLQVPMHVKTLLPTVLYKLCILLFLFSLVTMYFVNLFPCLATFPVAE
jgi:hypothetical protein